MEKLIVPSIYGENEDLAMPYELLIRKAFKCGRRGIWYADADTFRIIDASEEKLQQRQHDLRIYVATALKILLTYRSKEFKEEEIKQFETLLNKLWCKEIMPDEVVKELSDNPNFLW